MGALELVRRALVLDAPAFDAIVTRPDGLTVALAILLASGFSNAIGQSVALFANRVRPWRFVASLALGALLFALSVLVWGAAVTALASLAFSQPAEPRQVAQIVGLAHAPRLFAFLVLTPYFGSPLGALLTAWTMLAMAVGTREVFDLGLVESLLVLGVAWLATELLSRTLGRPIVALARGLRRFTAGTALDGAARRPRADRFGRPDEEA